MKTINATPGKYQVVRSNAGCTVTQTLADGSVISDNVPAGESTAVFAFANKLEIDDDSAVVREVFNAALIASSSSSAGGGNGGGSATGETVYNIQAPAFGLQHSIWFDNVQGFETLAILPAIWKNEVVTCYLKTAVPVTLTGVQWLYDEPAMLQGGTYVVALQQIDAATVLANLAYTF